jgi:hypothetical protein
VEAGVEPEDLRRTRWTSPRKTLPMLAMAERGRVEHATSTCQLAVVRFAAVCNLNPSIYFLPTVFLSLAATKQCSSISPLESSGIPNPNFYLRGTCLTAFPQPQLYRCVPVPRLRVLQDSLPAARLRRRSRAMANVLVCPRLCRRR